MNNQNQSKPSPEMLSLNLDDLNVEELERRLELAAVIPTCLRSADCGCYNQCINYAR